MTTQQQRILDAIPYGMNNAVSNKRLALMTGMSARRVQSEIQQMRLKNKLIASTTHPPYGYYIPSNEAEEQAYINQLRSRLNEQTQVLEAQEGARGGAQIRMEAV